MHPCWHLNDSTPLLGQVRNDIVANQNFNAGYTNNKPLLFALKMQLDHLPGCGWRLGLCFGHASAAFATKAVLRAMLSAAVSAVAHIIFS